MRGERDRIIRQLCLSQHGAFHRLQALEAGHDKWTIHRRLTSGAWTSLHESVYAPGDAPPTWERDQMGACLWADAAAYGVAAGHIWDLPGCDRPGIEILTARSKIVPHAGVMVHFTNRLVPDHLTVINRIPVTSIERTLLGLSAVWNEKRLAIALDDAFRRGLTDSDKIDAFLAITARRGRNGVKNLRKLAKQRANLDVAPSTALETLIWQLIVDEGLPIPECQVVIRDQGGIFVARVDFFYPDRDLVIEGQSYKWHAGLYAWHTDVDRFNALSELGYRVIQLTWKDVTTDRQATVARLRRLFS